MIHFWLRKNNRSWMQLTAAVIVFSFLFTTVSAPFAEASLWSERRKAVEELTSGRSGGSGEYSKNIGTGRGANNQSSTSYSPSSDAHLQLVSAAGLPIYQRSLLQGLETQFSPELMKQVMTKVQNRKPQTNRTKNQKQLALPLELVSRIESYGDIERVYLKNHKHIKLEKGKLQIDFQPSVIGIRQELNSPQALNSEPQPNSLVILVQDAHGIYEAQKNIAHLLKELTEMGVGLVGVEGSVGRMEGLEKWRKTSDKKILMGIAGCLMEKGLLTGVEVAGLSSESVLYCKNKIHDACLKSHGSLIEYYGVEDKDKYLEQLRSFKETLTYNKEVERWKEEINKQIRALKEKIYTEELKKFDDYKNKFENGEIKLGEWLEILVIQFIEQRSPNIKRYLEAYRLEKEIDFKKVSEEQKKVLEQLSAKLSKNELMGLLEESVAYRLGKIGYEEFYSGIKGRCDKAGINITPELNKYIKYVVGVEGIDRDRLFVEVKELEDKVWRKGGLEGSASKNSFKGQLLELIQIDKDYGLLEKAINFKLSPEEWEEYDSRKQELENIAQRIVELIRVEQTESEKLETKNLGKDYSKIGSVNKNENRFSKEMNEEFTLSSNESVKKVMKSVGDFNRLSHERNQIFVEKLLSKIESKTISKESNFLNLESSNLADERGLEQGGKKLGITQIPNPKLKISILVAGGYHSRGVEELLRKKNISYITIRPHLNTGEIAKDYHPLNAFKRDLLPLEKMFYREKVSIAFPQATGGMDPNEITPEEAGVDGTLSVVTEGMTRMLSKLRTEGLNLKEAEELRKLGKTKDFKSEVPIHSEEVQYQGRRYRVFSPKKEEPKLNQRFLSNHEAELEKDEKLSKRLLSNPEEELEAEEILDGAKNVWSGQMKDPFTGEVGQTFAVGEKPQNIFLQIAERIKVGLNEDRKIVKFAKRVLEHDGIKAAAWIFGVPLSLIAYHGIHGSTWVSTGWIIGIVLFLVSSAFISLVILVIFGRRSEFIHLIIISRLPQALQRIWYRITIPVYSVEISGLRFFRLKVNRPKAKVLVIEPLSLEIISELNRRFGDMDIDLLDIRSELVKEGESWRPGIHGKLLELVKSQNYDYVVGYINENYDEDFFREAKLKGLILFSTAIHHIDLDAATKYGTVVTNAPGPTTIPVAEGLIAFFLDVIYSNKIQTKKSKDYTCLSELKSDPENSLVIAHALWYILMRNVLKLEEMFKFGASDKYVRVGVGEEATVYHGKIGQSVYDESSPTIGIIGLDEVGLKLAEIAMAHEPATIYVLKDELDEEKLLRLNSYKEIIEQTSTTERLTIQIRPVSLSELLKHSSYVLRTPAGVQSTKGSRMKITSDANQIFIRDMDELINLTRPIEVELKEEEVKEGDVGKGKRLVSPMTVGVLGLGRIGEASAQRFISLGANLLIQQRDPGRQEYVEKRARLAQLAEVVGERLNRSIEVQYVDKETFLKQSNVISLSPPKKTNETVGWVNAESLEIFGELAQGNLRSVISITKDVVDETAMIAYLKSHPEVEYRPDVASDEEKGGFFKRFIDSKGNRLKNAKVSGHSSAAHGGSKKAKQRIAFNNNLRQLMMNKRPANQLNDIRVDSSGITFLDQTSEANAYAQRSDSLAAATATDPAEVTASPLLAQAPYAPQIQILHAEEANTQTQSPAPVLQTLSALVQGQSPLAQTISLRAKAPPLSNIGTPVRVTSQCPMGQLAKTAAEMIEAAFIIYYEKFFTITARAKLHFDEMDWEGLLQDVEERLSLYNDTLNDLENGLRTLLKNKLRDIPMWIEIQGRYSERLIDNRILGANPYVIGMVFSNSIAKRIFGPEADVFEYTFEEDMENRTLETNESFLYPMVSNRLPMEYILTDILVKLEFRKPLRDIRKDIRRAVTNIDSELAKLALTQDHIKEIEVVKAPFFRNRDCYMIGRITTESGFLPFALLLKNTKQGITLSKVLLNADDIYRLFSSTRANFHVLFYYPLELVAFLTTMIQRS